uniref:Putative 11.9 kDa midgut protein n=1 Tax=Nyssomyia neivai TaxID=330878 RepID=A0A1L8DA38_9DIPT
MEKKILKTLLLFLGISQGFSLQCYDCNSIETPSCADPLNTNSISKDTCGPNEKCGKGILSANIGGTKQTVTFRGCVYNDATCELLADLLTQVAQANVTVNHCSFCHNDLCNKSPSITGGIFAVLPLIVLYLISKIRLTI